MGQAEMKVNTMCDYIALLPARYSASTVALPFQKPEIKSFCWQEGRRIAGLFYCAILKNLSTYSASESFLPSNLQISRAENEELSGRHCM